SYSCSRPPLLHPPFPTRRSSDLNGQLGILRQGYKSGVLKQEKRTCAVGGVVGDSHRGAVAKRIYRSRLAGIYPKRLVMDDADRRSEEHTSELQSRFDLVCRLLLE